VDSSGLQVQPTYPVVSDSDHESLNHVMPVDFYPTHTAGSRLYLIDVIKQPITDGLFRISEYVGVPVVQAANLV